MPTTEELLGLLSAPGAAAPATAPSQETADLLGMLKPAAQPRYQQTLSQSPEVWRQRLNLDAREDRQGLPRGTMTRLVRLVSGGDPTGNSRARAQGLWQLMPETAAGYKVDPFNPEQATDAAEKELGSLWRKYNGSLPHMVAAWNWGQANLDRKGLDKAPPETRTMIANMGADVPADMRAQGVQFARPSTVLPVTSIATEQGTIPALAAPSPTIPGSFLLEQLRQLEPGAAVKPPLLEEKWPEMGVGARGRSYLGMEPPSAQPAATPGESVIKTSMVDPATGLIREGDILSDVSAGTTERAAQPGTLGHAALEAGKEGAAMGLQGIATTAGSVFGPVGAGLGSYWAHQFNKELGLTPGKPTLLPQDLGDGVALLPGRRALLPVAERFIPGVARARKALTKADVETERLTREAEMRAATRTQEDLRKAQEEFGARDAEVQARAA